MNYHFRKHPRLNNYDYAQNGAYFVTICTKHKQKLLSEICVGRDVLIPPNNQLTDFGRVTEALTLELPNHYQNLDLNKYVVMPNHIHLLLRLNNVEGTESSPSLQTIIRSYKTFITRSISSNIWQDSFYEHIVRNDEDYLRIWRYIDTNPAKWAEDKYYC